MSEKETLVTVTQRDLRRNQIDATLKAFEGLGATSLRAEQQEGEEGQEGLWYVQGNLIGVPAPIELDVSNL